MDSARNKPLLSVLMSAFNAEKFIAKAVESILNQTFQDFEFIVADDGSTDKTKSIINCFAQHPSIKIFHNELNKGKNETINELLRKSQGQYITVHDADDFSHHDRFRKQVEFLKNSENVMCGTGFFHINEMGEIMEERNMPTSYEMIRRDLLHQSQFHGPTMMMKKSIISQVGGMYRFFRNKEDVDLAVRIAEKYKANNLPDKLYYYRNHPSSLSKSGYDFMKFEGLKLIAFLAMERAKAPDKTDSLMRGNMDVVRSFMSELKTPYMKDKGLFHRKSAAHNLYFKFYKAAISQALQAVVVDPITFKNYRTLAYCIKKVLIHF